jgi:hypothetical protein
MTTIEGVKDSAARLEAGDEFSATQSTKENACGAA